MIHPSPSHNGRVGHGGMLRCAGLGWVMITIKMLPVG